MPSAEPVKNAIPGLAVNQNFLSVYLISLLYRVLQTVRLLFHRKTVPAGNRLDTTTV